MGDKAVEEAKKTIKSEVKSFNKKTKKTVDEAKKLRKEKGKLDKKGAKLSADDKKKKFDVVKSLKDLEKRYLKEMNTTNARLQRSLKNFEPPKKEQGGMAKWYSDFVKKESGLGIGKGLKIWGDYDFKKQQPTLILKGTFLNDIR